MVPGSADRAAAALVAALWPFFSSCTWQALSLSLNKVLIKVNLHCSRQQCRWQCSTVCGQTHWWRYILGTRLFTEKNFHCSRLPSSSLLATLCTPKTRSGKRRYTRKVLVKAWSLQNEEIKKREREGKKKKEWKDVKIHSYRYEECHYMLNV